MELKHLRTFLTLCEIKNFTKAAEQLNYAQSNVTAQIKQLETELGVLLFNRMGHKISLTEQGKELLSYTTQILSLVDDATEQIQLHKKSKMTIAASESICIYRLPRILSSFKKEYPDVEIHIRMIDTDNFIPFLYENAVDFAFALESPIVHPSIRHFIHHDEPIGVFAFPDHPLTAKVHLCSNDFNDVSMILTEENCCYRRAFLHDLSQTGARPNIVLETSSLQVIKEMAMNGLGICVLPEIAVEKELKEEKLIQLDYHPSYAIASQLICHKDKRITPEMEAFIHCAAFDIDGNASILQSSI